MDIDPKLPAAATFLEPLPEGREIDTKELAEGMGVPLRRAQTMLAQLEALGYTSRPDDQGERVVFNPDGATPSG